MCVECRRFSSILIDVSTETKCSHFFCYHTYSYRKLNIFDNMIAMMEKYAYNLEGLVQERTNQLMGEKKKTENLLLRMLPK